MNDKDHERSVKSRSKLLEKLPFNESEMLELSEPVSHHLQILPAISNEDLKNSGNPPSDGSGDGDNLQKGTGERRISSQDKPNQKQ